MPGYVTSMEVHRVSAHFQTATKKTEFSVYRGSLVNLAIEPCMQRLRCGGVCRGWAQLPSRVFFVYWCYYCLLFISIARSLTSCPSFPLVRLSSVACLRKERVSASAYTYVHVCVLRPGVVIDRVVKEGRKRGRERVVLKNLLLSLRCSFRGFGRACL